MPSEPPLSSNGYQLEPAPARPILNRTAFNAFGADLHARFAVLEDIGSGIATIQAELQSFGITRLNDAINPLIADTQATLDQLVIDLNAAIAELNADLAAAQDQIDLLLAGGIPAANVAESGTQVFVTPAEKTEITTLRTDLDAVNYAALRPVVAVTAAHTAIPGQRILADCTGGAFNIKTVEDPADGETFTVYPTGFTVSVIPNDASAATTIMGETSVTISQPNVAAEFEHHAGVWLVTRRSFPNG